MPKPAIFPALDIGTTISAAGETVPTVVIDATDAADAGTLVIAHTPPEQAAIDQPTWLAIDLDGDALRAKIGADQ